MTTQQLILQDRSVLEAMALEAVAADLYYELHDNLDNQTDQDLMTIIMYRCNDVYFRAKQFIDEGCTYAGYIADEQIEQLPVLAAYEWRNLGGTR